MLRHILEGFDMSKVKQIVRGYMDYDTDARSNETALECKDVSLAVQSQADEADINTIVRNFGLTGKVPENPRVPSFGDFSEVFDYQSAMNAIIEVNSGFMELPAEVRARFDNDPQKLLLFADNPANLEEMRKLGLAKPKIDMPVIPEGDPTPGGA